MREDGFYTDQGTRDHASPPSSALVALSGGVDSSVAAATLLEASWHIEGLFLKFGPEVMTGASRRAAAAVADHLGVPLHVLDLEKVFAAEVRDYFLRTYAQGLTPNPCVVCNREIKFHFGIREANRLGLAHFATGHYARTEPSRLDNYPALRRGLDARKDQSYFLNQIPSHCLSRFIFPLGHTTKPEVRKQARRLGLSGLIQAESQEICFLRGDYRSFLRAESPDLGRPGEIVTLDGKIVGHHQGLHAYTIGQRRGLGLQDLTPYYVLALDTKKNRLVIGKKKDLKKENCLVADVNWLVARETALASACTVQIRYRHQGAQAHLTRNGHEEIRVHFATPQRAITPGQFAVFYRGDRVLGGGVICG